MSRDEEEKGYELLNREELIDLLKLKNNLIGQLKENSKLQDAVISEQKETMALQERVIYLLKRK